MPIDLLYGIFVLTTSSSFGRVVCQVRALMSKDVEVKAHIIWICLTPKPWGNISPFDYVIFWAVQQIATSIVLGKVAIF